MTNLFFNTPVRCIVWTMVLMRVISLCGLICAVTRLSVLAQSPSDYAVQVSAQVQSIPPTITLTWPADPRIVSHHVFRKLRDETSWSGPVSLGGSEVTTFVDTGVVVGGAYEYRVKKYTDLVLGGEGYIYAGIQVPLVQLRGKIVLIVDETHAAGLTSELTRLQQDLVGDGWMVLRHDVPRMTVDPANLSSGVWAARLSELISVKDVISAEYLADPVNVKAVLLFGHVPVPYSGDIFPDAHAEHRGAWPVDGFYGDMDGAWTDSIVNRSTASDPRNKNVPGDGKFDQSIWPLNSSGVRAIELAVGRVDLANLGVFSQSEQELLRRYLDKDHQFRHKTITVQRRGLIDDNLGYFGSEAPAQNAWRNFAPFFGAENNFETDWMTPQSYLWGYGCGAGTASSCSGVVTTSGLASGDPQIVFTMLFGSYFGDWDSPNNLLRASLATPTYTLASTWVARPGWHFHHMALGETIGFSTRLVQSNDGLLYSANGMQNVVHVALMGDPTLRMHPVGPPSVFSAIGNASGEVDLNWMASSDSVLGYHVYRAAALSGPYTRVNGALINGTDYTDPNPGSDTHYMVRAVKLEVSGSGSYYNASQGIFATVTAPPPSVSGTVRYYAGAEVIPDTLLTLAGDASDDTTTASDGAYSFQLTPGGDYTVTPSKTTDATVSAGITALDNALIQRHVVGLSSLDSPYKLIAADVNGSQTITALDNALIQRLIVGFPIIFPAGMWKFVRSDYAFPTPTMPWTFPSSRTYSDVSSVLSGQDFFGIKLGDVNGSWKQSTAGPLNLHEPVVEPGDGSGDTPGAPVILTVNSPAESYPGQLLTVPIVVSNFNSVSSVQFTLQWDPASLEFFAPLESQLPGLTQENWNAEVPGKLAFAWADPSAKGITLPDGNVLLTLQYKLVGSATNAIAVGFIDAPTPREVSVAFRVASAGWNDARLVPIQQSPPPRALGARLSVTGDLLMQFSGVPGLHYTIEHTSNLSAPVWAAIENLIADANGEFRYSAVPSSGNATGFYRAVLTLPVR